MSEQDFGPSPELGAAETPVERYIEILEELELWRESPPPAAKPDWRIGAYAAGLLQASEEDPQVASALLDFTIHRESMSANDGANLILRAIQKQLLRRAAELNYPEDYLDPERWTTAVKAIVNTQESYEELMVDLLTRHMQSNVSERYKSAKLIMLALQERLGPEPRILDIGCSQNLGLKKLGLGLEFNAVPVMTRSKEDRDQLVPDYEMTRHINALLGQPFTIGPSFGIDILPLRDQLVAEWTESCSFYPTELLDSDRRSEYRDLISREFVRRVSFSGGDFSEIGSLNMPMDRHVHNYDAVLFYTTLYLHSQTERLQQLVNALRFLKPGGVVIVQEFAALGKDPTNPFEFYEHWFAEPWRYNTYVYDDLQPERGFQPIFQWEGGRCVRVQLGVGELAVNGRLRRADEDLFLQAA